MNRVPSTDNVNNEVMYPFRFGTSNKSIRLTQQQLDRIPYLSALIAHRDDFLSVQNKDGEYILNSRIRYNWFMAILSSITTEQPSALFTELSTE
ncbi:unnamed protein product, partial [Rotaria sp. Silwood2]